MAFARVQGNSSYSAASATTIAVTITAVGNGNAIGGLVSWENTGVTLTSVTDDKSNTYNLETEVIDTTNVQRGCAFSRTNITNGPVTITANFSASVGFRTLIVDEFSGGSTASSDERDGAAHGGQLQTTPGTGTDAVTSGTFTTTQNGDLIYGATIDTNGPNVATVGTGFSTGTVSNVPDYTSQTEFRTQASAGSGTAATFTQPANQNHITYMIALKPPGGVVAAPFVQDDWPVTQAPIFPTSLRNWTWTYNLNLIGQDVLPPGRRGVLYDDPSRGYLPAGQTWTWQYNPNLVARDDFPPGRRGAFADLAPRGYPPPGDTWTWQYNLNLISKDVLPPGRQRSERPTPIWWYREWTQNLLLSTLSVTIQTPFNQYNWPLPQRALQPDRTQVESLVLTTLLSQDTFPPGQQRTEAPPPVSWRRDWTQSLVLSTLAGQDQLPAGVVSNRVIVAAPEQRSWTQNLLSSTLAPVIQTPLNQYDWPLPARPATPGQTWTLNLLLTTLAPPVVLPFNQYDWPVPQRASQPDRSFVISQNLNLIGQDQLPVRQMDWPVPNGYIYPSHLRNAVGLNPNLFPPPPPPVISGELRNPQFVGQTTGQMMTWGRW